MPKLSPLISPANGDDDFGCGGLAAKFSGPNTFTETMVVRKPLGVRIHKSTLRVTYVEPNAAAAGEIFVGDKLIALDGHPIKTIKDVNEKLKEAGKTVKVRVERGAFSWCKYTGTTVEMLQLDKDLTKATGRAIDVIKVLLNFRFMLDMEDQKEDLVFHMSVRYDARERVQIVNCGAGGIAAIHLRPGDIIRDVNDRAIASKEMLQFYVLEGIAENDGRVMLTIERAVGGADAYRDQIEMSADVVAIAQKQIAAFKASSSKEKPAPVLNKIPKKGNVHVSTDPPKEMLIQSDHDPASLKSVKSASK